MLDFIQEFHKWTANIMIILFIYSSIMWFWFSKDKQKIKNASFRILIKLEMILSGLLFVLGIIVLITNPDWFSKNLIYFKIILGFAAIGAIHIGAMKTKRFIESDMNEKDIKPLNIIRALTIILLMTVYTTGTMIQSVNDPKTQETIKKLKNDPT